MAEDAFDRYQRDVAREGFDLYAEPVERKQTPVTDEGSAPVKELAETPAWRSASGLLAAAISGFTLQMGPEAAEQLIEEALRRFREEVRGTIRQQDESPYWTIEEAAAYARTTPDRIRKLRSSGVLSQDSIGGNALVIKEELIAYCKRGTRRGRRD